jgi:hypothetical protein
MCRGSCLVQNLVDTVTAVTLKCRCWRCEQCAEERRCQLIKRIVSGQPDTFITLTWRAGNGATPLEARRVMAWAWNQAVRRIKRRYGIASLPFVCVTEAHLSGFPHFHILARCKWIDQSWLSQVWEELTGAFRVDIRRIQDRGRAVAYCAKYLGKAPSQFGTMKRYYFSRDYDTTWSKEPPAGETRGSSWRVERCTLRELNDRFPQHAWLSSLVRDGMRWTRRC